MIISKDIEQAAEILKMDDVVSVPTETVYGLAGNAFSKKAVEQIFEVKERPFYDPLIVHIAHPDQLNEIATEIPESAYKLAKTFWPGPLTLVLKKRSIIPDIVTAGKPTVAVRVPEHSVMRDLLFLLDFPLAAPSANLFGSISPTSASHVYNGHSGKIKMVLDGGQCSRGVESTIVGFEENGDPVLYRPGAITIDEITEIVGEIKIHTKENLTPIAPGMLDKHYSPSTPAFLTEDPEKDLLQFPAKKVGVLMFREIIKDHPVDQQEVLSKTGDMNEAAASLYSSLHFLDSLGLDLILIEKLPEQGLGITINDRLGRAAKLLTN